jgi:hypothetical protein
MQYLDEMDSLGLCYYFQYTILGYPREIDPKCPSLEAAVRAFREVSDHVGPKRMVWRYDPIVITEKTPADYHKQRFAEIASELKGQTHRSVVSIVDDYRKAEPRMAALKGKGAAATDCDSAEFDSLMRELAASAAETGMDITSCAEEIDLSQHGIRNGRCVDSALIADAFGINVSSKKDPSQRKTCGCVVSRDIGMYDSCVFGCPYCYATGNFERARVNCEGHDPQSPSLLGWHEPRAESDVK